MRKGHVKSRRRLLGDSLLFLVMVQSARALAGIQLPVACAPGTCGTYATTLTSNPQNATTTSSANSLTVHQNTNDVTLNWASFNIGAGGKVIFQQPSATSIAMNRIYDANPSGIFGTLTANGQIYLINANGFLFGPTATVNVGGLLASSLYLTDATFAAGLLAPGATGQPALVPILDGSGNVRSQPIIVDDGASLTAADGGRLLLAAPLISNAGTLTAPDGQVILAAGQTLYLQASSDSNLRGLIVEVDNAGTLLNPPAGIMSGTVTNQASGLISSPRGNVTLTGLMVNQDGRVSATTSVAANGSVILQAADQFNLEFVDDRPVFTATQGGTVELGPGSLTEVLPELNDTTTAVAAQTQLQSSISITGQQVLMHDATIDAPSGLLNVLAAADPASIQSAGNPDAQIRIDSGTSIDLAGSVAVLPMSANLLTVQLRSNEFADDPTQRGGPLQSTAGNTVSVTVDIRADGGAGTPIADLSSAIAGIGQNIAQRTEAGGTATFESEGDVVFSPNASINVSGGYTTYLGGTIQTTKLIGANGQLYDIGSANPLLAYTGIINPTLTQTYNKWGVQDVIPTPGLSEYESTYVQGASAGSIQFAAPSLQLNGALQATAVSGPYQRSAPAAGGTLTIGLPEGISSSSTNIDYFSPSVELSSNPPPVDVADGTPLPQQTLQLPTSYLTADGFTNTQIYSNTSITIPAGLALQLTPGASLTLAAPRIDVDSSITSIDGHLSFENELTSASSAAGTPRAGISVGDDVTLNVSGQWTNDDILADGVGSALILQNAGSISLQLTTPGSELDLGNQVELKANGGAWVQSGGTVSYGNGGSITLDASPAQSALQIGADTTVEGFAAGTAKGGSFSLLASRIEVSQGSGDSWASAQRIDDLDSSGQVLQLYAPLFSQDGFSTISLTATGAVESTTSNDVLTLAAGTTIDAETSSLRLDPDYLAMPTGSALSGFTQVGLLPLYERPTVSVSLDALREADDIALGNTNYGLIDIQAGASIIADPGSTITLSGEGGVSIAGTLRAPGGTITVAIPAPADINSAAAIVTDPGYLPSLGIDLAPTAVLDVSGTTVPTPNSQGLLSGMMLPGGAVNLLANRGTVVAEAGSTIDIAGSSSPLDVPNGTNLGGYTLETVASAGGSLTVSSGESVSLLGNLAASAGVGNSGAAAAGSLEVDLVRLGDSVVQSSAPGLPGSSLQIELVDTTAGTAPSPSDSNIAILGAQQIAESGVDSLTLRAGGTSATGDILIDAGQLSLGRSLVLDSPSVTVPATTTLSAPFVEIGNSVTNGASASAPTPSSGNGNLLIAAQQMTLYGNFALQGTTSATLSSAGDVQLEGTSPNDAVGPTTGSVLTSGSLASNAQRVYPDTYTDFSITSLPGNGASVSIGRTGASPGTPLSADGTVSISADNIAVTGNLYAPFGSIDLVANQNLTVGRGSLISVSGAGLDVPFGETELNQGEWIYVTPNGQINQINSVPSKQISLSAPNIDMQAGATANVQGGGDLYAYEWVPGTGGTFDNLNALSGATASNSTISSIANLYAILPSERNQAGPYDPEESAHAVPGQTIYLSGGAGIAAGYYALLPPRYALAPGAVLIQLQTKDLSANGGQIGALADGTPVIGGFLTTGTTGLHTGNGLTEYEGVAIFPAGYAEKLAAYTISNASTYFGDLATKEGTGPVAQSADAGTFTLSVTPAAINSLDLNGDVLTSAASGGAGAQVNISAPNLEITAANSATNDGSIQILGSVLQSWNASSLTLGGVASTASAPGTDSSAASTSTGLIAVAANMVTVDSGVKLSADQIQLVAQQSIDVQGGASLMSTSATNGKVLGTLPAMASVELTDTTTAANALPQAALLAVSDLALPVVERGSLNGVAGASITVEPGAVLASGGALAVDAPGVVSLADGTLSGKGASWSLSSSSVAIASANAGSGDNLNIDASLLSVLQQAAEVRIASQGNLDISAPVTLGISSAGAPTLSSLTLIANQINNRANGDSEFGAQSLTLGGNIAPDVANPPAPGTAGAGNLSFVADNFTVGTGVVTINGFSQTTAQIAGAVETKGAGFLNVGGNLTINATELTPAPDAADEPGTTIATTGVLTIGTPVAAAAGTSLPSLVGGSLTLSAADIEDSGAIVAPSGIVALNSTGNLHLSSTASIDAAGTTIQVVDQSAPSPGGFVMLTADGNISLDQGSVISVAGSSAGGSAAPAGILAIQAANGSVAMSGVINGAGNGGTGGSLSVDAGSLSGGLMSLVGNPGLAGFSESVDIRVHNGPLMLGAGAAITANQIVLTADSANTGEIDIEGMLNAPSAAQRGYIDVSGGEQVILGANAQLNADGSPNGGRGGEIDLSSVSAICGATTCTASGLISLDSGSVITTSGGAADGELVLRAPVLGNSNLVAINQGETGLGATLTGVAQVIVEPVIVSPTSGATVNSDLANDVSNAVTFLTTTNQAGVSNQSAIAARMSGNAKPAAPIDVQAGIELQDPNGADSLTIQSIDLSQNSTQGQVVDVDVRAAGSILISGTISDGFVAGSGGTNPTTPTNMPSGSLSFVAGADLSSANSLSVLPGSLATLTLDPTTIVRTGTGNISLAAAGDVILQSDTSGGASVYTGGVDGAAPVVFGKGSNLVTGFFPTGGGNILVDAGGNVVGAPFLNPDLDAGDFSVTGWQPRGTAAAPTQGGAAPVPVGEYAVNYDQFDWNLGALAGGDLTVIAGSTVTNLSAATADSSPNGNATVYGGGGGLRVTAVGDIGSAQIYVADGIGTITTGAGLTPIISTDIGTKVGSSFALGDAQISVWARQGVQVDAIYNPTFSAAGTAATRAAGQFFTYGANSALNLSSTDGAITLNLEPVQDVMGLLLGPNLIDAGAGVPGYLDLPANLSMRALQQDINLGLSGSGAILYPSDNGQLVLFAGQDIVANGSGISMSDSSAFLVPTAASAVTPQTGPLLIGGLAKFQGAIHSDDPDPALITAGRDIDNLVLSIPKAAQVSAGRDIVNIGYSGQNIAATDTTLITAGRDIIYPLIGGAAQIQVGGEGSLDVFAGRDVDLGTSGGITTTGNLENANLPSANGADMTIAVGYGSSGADYTAFLNSIITPSPAYEAQLIAYVEAQTGETGLKYAQAQTAFAGLDRSQQTALIDAVFYNELLLSGRAANAGSGVGFAQGYAAINALFPGSRQPTSADPDPYAGDLTLISSQIYTLGGGNISLLVPGGSIDVGLAFTPVGVTQKSASQLGIVAEGAGNVDIYAEGDVNVNASRIFTLGGGNILIWSDTGSIDAGNGSKSSLSVPPPVVLVNQDGSISLDYGASLAAGSGIRTIQTNPQVPAGDVDLDAPLGTVNAGDAGIGAAGNINIAAAHVLGVANINFGGSASGVPSDLSGLGASLSGVSAIASSSTSSSTSSVTESNANKDSASLASNALSWLDVFVTSLGEEGCRQDDIECLKRQKPAAP